MSSFKRDFANRLLTSAFYNYSAQAVYFLSTIILSRLLVPREYGFVTLITVFTNFISIFSDAGISHGVVRSDYGRTYQKALHSLTIFIGVGLFLLMVLLAYPIALFYNNYALIPATIVLSILFILRSIAIVPTAILYKRLDFKSLGRFTLVVTLLNTVFTIILALLKFSYWAIILPQVITALLHYLLLERKVQIGLKIYPARYLKSAYHNTRSLIGNVTGFNLINYWAGNTDSLLVGKMYGETNLGLYNRAYSLMAIALNLIGGLFNIVIYPSFKELKSRNGNLHKEYENILGFITLINFPVGFILIMFPTQLVQLLWGKNWINVADFMPYFGVLLMSKTLLASTTNIYILFGKEKINMYIGLFSAFVMVVAISSGAFISITYIIFFHSLAYVLFVLPANVYFGFYRAIGYRGMDVIQFWLPKIILYTLLIICIKEQQHFFSFIILVIYLAHIILTLRFELTKIFMKVRFSLPL